MANLDLENELLGFLSQNPKFTISQDKIKQKPDVGTMIYPTPCL